MLSDVFVLQSLLPICWQVLNEIELLVFKNVAKIVYCSQSKAFQDGSVE